jgi:hypothetical protein
MKGTGFSTQVGASVQNDSALSLDISPEIENGSRTCYYTISMKNLCLGCGATPDFAFLNLINPGREFAGLIV